jgi:hypothetical protein
MKSEIEELRNQFKGATDKQILEWMADYEKYASDLLKIKTKRGIKPFVFKRVQKRLTKMVQEKLVQGLPVRLYVLKARQVGVSTWAEGLGSWLLSFGRGKEGLVVSHEIKSASRIFGMLQLFWLLAPPDLRPLRRISNRREMSFENPRSEKDGYQGNLSKIEIATADNKNFGVSATLHFVHLSELARYPQVNADIESTLFAMEQSVPNEPETFIIYETTAQGQNIAQEIWEDESNGFLKVFISWAADDEYRLEEHDLMFSDLSEVEAGNWGNEKEIIPHLKRELKFWYPEEYKKGGRVWLRKEVLSRLAWRRKILSASRKGKRAKSVQRSLELFRQEYPIHPAEAFLTSGRSVFDNIAIYKRKKYIASRGISPLLYQHDNRKRNFYRAEYGHLRVYEPPQPNARYVIGADVSEGLEQADKSAAQVLKLPELVQVATFEDTLEPDDFGDLLWSLGHKYNKAPIAVEVTGIGAATNLRLRKLYYPRLYRRLVIDSGRKGESVHSSKEKKFGFSTNRGTKGIIVNDLRAAFNGGTVLLFDEETLEQMGYYVQNQKTRSYGAVSGKNDDLVAALMMAWQMVLQASTSTQISVPSNIKKSIPGTMDWWLQHTKTSNPEDILDAPLGSRDFGRSTEYL